MLVVLAWPLALLSGALVVVGVLAVLLMALGAKGDNPDCLCGDTGPRAADAIVQARVASRDGDDYLLDVSEVERGPAGMVSPSDSGATSLLMLSWPRAR